MGFLTSIVGIIVSLPGGFFFIVKPRSTAAHEIVDSRSMLNEKESVPLLMGAIAGTLDGKGISYEVVFVDDGSTDGHLRPSKSYMKGMRRMSAFSASAVTTENRPRSV